MTEEEALINSFIIKNKRERFIDLLANPKPRAKVTSSLAHFNDLAATAALLAQARAYAPQSGRQRQEVGGDFGGPLQVARGHAGEESRDVKPGGASPPS